jgi:hypothetical protein
LKNENEGITLNPSKIPITAQDQVVLNLNYLNTHPLSMVDRRAGGI